MRKAYMTHRVIYILFIFYTFLSNIAVAGSEQTTTNEVFITKFTFKSNSQDLPLDIAKNISTPYANKKNTISDISKLIIEIKISYQKQGYFVDLEIPEQDSISDNMNININETIIESIEEPNIIKSRLASIKKNKPLSQAKIVRNIKQIQEDTGITPSVKITPLSNNSVGVNISTEQTKNWMGYVSVDNTGDTETGRERATFYYSNYAFPNNNRLDIFYQTSLRNPEDVQIIGGSYRIPFYENGNSIDLGYTYSKSNQGTINNLLSINGTGQSYNANLSHRWLPTENSWMNISSIGLGVRIVDNNAIIADTNLLKNLRSNVLSIEHKVSKDWDTGKIYGGISLQHNLPFGDYSQDDNFKWNRATSNNNYDLIKFNGGLQKYISNNYMLAVRLGGQWTDDALPAHELIGIGGASSVRGFNERALSDDKGFNISTELYFPGWTRDNLRVIPLVFYDGGWAWKNKAQLGDTSRNRISSTGIGFRITLFKKININTDLAYILHSDLPQESPGNMFFHIAIGWVF